MKCYFLLAIITLASTTCLFSQKATVPRFESALCPVEVPKGEQVDCGYLVVREDRSSGSDRTIRLPIAILKSNSSARKPDPVLRTFGGPGASSMRMVRARRSSPWLNDRDMIIFEQRGTKYAQPALECPEVDKANIESNKKMLAAASAKKREIAAMKACYDRLRAEGIELSAYNSAESAADIDDLRHVLGIEKINLYGVSYSARLMLDVIRLFPAGIRSVVLESILPPEVNYDEVGVDGIVRTLNELFQACRDDADCSAAFPELETEFYAVVARLNAEPLTENVSNGKVHLTGNDFATWIVDYLFSNEPAATVDAPLIIHRAFTSDYGPFRKYAADKLNGSNYSWGMRYSVWCSEEMPFEDPKLITAQSTKYPGLKGYEVMSLPEICRVWKVKRAPVIENKPVISDIPTLILSAQYDAYTPPSWGKQTSKHLSNSFYFEVPWAGHAPGFSVPCVGGMIAAFIDRPNARPSDSCITETKTKFKFTTPKPQAHLTHGISLSGF